MWFMSVTLPVSRLVARSLVASLVHPLNIWLMSVTSDVSSLARLHVVMAEYPSKACDIFDPVGISRLTPSATRTALIVVP